MKGFLSASEEHTLVVQAQAGDMEARDKAILGIMPFIYKTAVGIAYKHPPAEADDLAQEAVVLIVQRFHCFKPHLGFRLATYFLPGIRQSMLRHINDNGIVSKIAGPKALKGKSRDLFVRHAGPLRSLSEVVLDLLLAPRDGGDSDRDELAQAVRNCVARLPDLHRRIVQGRFAEGQTLEEVGKGCGLSHQQISNRLKQALHWLKGMLLAEPVVREFAEEHGACEPKAPPTLHAPEKGSRFSAAPRDPSELA